jgi:hypothetical protein
MGCRDRQILKTGEVRSIPQSVSYYKGLSFKDKKRIAQRSERLIARWLMSLGWYVLPSYNYSGEDDNKAPKLLRAGSKSFIVPDLLIAKDGVFRWVEVKTKTERNRYAIGRCWNTGFDSNHWCHYKEVARITGTEVWVAFVHAQDDEILYDSMANLGKFVRHYTEDKMGPGGMVFFNCDRIPTVGKLSEFRKAFEKRGKNE